MKIFKSGEFIHIGDKSYHESHFKGRAYRGEKRMRYNKIEDRYEEYSPYEFQKRLNSD